MTKITKLQNTCPNCKYKTDITKQAFGGKLPPETLRRSTGEIKDTPTVGDFSLCSRCGEILQFDASLGLTLASIQDLQEFRQRDRLSYTQLLQAQIAIRMLKGGRKN